MKKFLSILLCTAMLVSSFAFLASANDESDVVADSSAPVKVVYENISVIPTVYSVDISFGSMQFTYRETSWNPEDHTLEGLWVYAENANKITVTNHSNAPIKATMTYEQSSDYSNIIGEFDKTTLNLATAVGTAINEAPTASARLNVSGSYSGSTTSYATVGSVTVTITKG